MSVPTAAEWKAFLAEFKAYDFTSSPTPFRLVSLKTTDKLFKSVRTMLQHHTSSVAVFDEGKANFVGFVDVLDVATIVFLLSFTNSIKSVLGDKEPTWGEFSRKELQVLATQTMADVANLSGRDPWREVAFQATAEELLAALVPGGARRVCVRDAGNAGVEGIVSQWDAVRFLQRQIVHKHYFAATRFADIVPAAVHEARYGRRVVAVSENALTMDAFTKLAEESVTGAAVVDEHSRLVGVISASDFLRARRDVTLHEWDHFFDDLREPVSAYLNRRNAYFPGQYSKAPITVRPEDTVLDVLNKFTSAHVHRLFVVDDAFRPIGVWSLSDVIQVFLRYQGVPEKKEKKEKKEGKKDGKKNKDSKDKKKNKK